MSGPSSSHGVTLDPPFRGYIETTFDALLVFEAAKRGMIPRVTRRLIERERSMVQSGAVFVFDEQESGIKRWTDGLTWSPSRILGNFLVYRETDKPNGTTSGGSPSQTPAPRVSTTTAMGPPGESTTPPSYAPPLGQGALQRPRSVSEGGGQGIDRQRERQLVGSLTNSYKFKDSGLVKKHMISYYNLEDVTAGRLRTPSTILELAALEISPDYLAKQNFRFPPQIEVGPDGVPRYRGELEEPGSPPAAPGFYLPEVQYDPYGGGSAPPSAGQGMTRYDHPEMRRPSLVAPIPIPGQPAPPQGYYPPSPYYEVRDGAQGRVPRPNSSQARRYDPYGPTSPRSAGTPLPGPSQSRRPSQPSGPIQPAQPAQPAQGEYYPPTSPSSLPIMSAPNPFAYNPPPSAGPASFSDLYVPDQHEGVHSPNMSYPPNQGQYQWPAGGQPSRLMPGQQAPPMRPPGSAGSGGSPTRLHTGGGEGWTSAPPPPSASGPQAPRSHQHPHQPMPISPLGQPPWDPRHQHPQQPPPGDGRGQAYAVDQWQ